MTLRRIQSIKPTELEQIQDQRQRSTSTVFLSAIVHPVTAVFDQYLASSRVVNATTVRWCKQSATGPRQVGDTYRRQH